MKPPLATHILWALMVITAFLFGLFIAKPTSEGGAGVRSSERTTAGPEHSASIEQRESPFVISLSASAPLTREQAKVLTFEALSENNRVERTRKMCELLARVNSENWKEVMEGFRRQTIAEGRTHHDLWDLMLERVGEVVGRSAVSEMLASSDSREQARVGVMFKGWVVGDPKSALEWFTAQTDEVRQRLEGNLIFGLARSDPAKALELAIAKTPGEQENMIPTIISGAIQRAGFREAESLIKPLLDRSDIADANKGRLFYWLGNRKLEMSGVSGDSFEALNWLGGYANRAGYPGPNITRNAVSVAARSDLQSTFDWLEARSPEMSAGFSKTAYTTIAEVWNDTNQAEFASWIDNHPDHPQRDVLVDAVAGYLVRQNRNEELKTLVSRMKDPSLRDKVEQRLSKAAQAAQAAQ